MKKISKYSFSISLGMQRSMEYRADFLTSILSAVFPIIIQVFLWTAIYKTTNQAKVYGYTYNQIIMYTLLAGLIAKLVSTGFEYEVNEDIKNGGLNKYIVKPISYFAYRMCCFIGSKIFSSLILIVITVCIIINFSMSHGFIIHPERILIFILSLICALILNFLIFFCMSMLCFWISEVARLFGTINIILIVLSGGIFPVEILGSKILFFLTLLPFKYTVQFPIDILNGKLTQNYIIEGLIIQFAWICILFIAATKIWKIGLKKYVAVGG